MSQNDQDELNDKLSSIQLISPKPHKNVGIQPKRRHSRLSFLPRVASEVNDGANSLTKNCYRLVIMGSGGVGKTSIIKQFLYDNFPEEHHPTVEELHQSEHEIKGVGIVPVEILDTSGSFSFPAMQRLAISSGSAFILVYSVDNKESFDELCSLREMIIASKANDNHDNHCDQVPIVIAGNKCDLEDKRCISREMVEFECIDWEVGFVECSAKRNENIVQIFQQLLLQAHLKGTFNIASNKLSSNLNFNLLATSSNTSSSSASTSSTSKHDRRRRSSLPITELLHSKALRYVSRSPNKKRNSCTPM